LTNTNNSRLLGARLKLVMAPNYWLIIVLITDLSRAHH